jgi:fibronectin-binding autotransporter adhesin
MKPLKFLISCLFVLSSLYGMAQAVGDYRSQATGPWTTLATWQRLNSTGPEVWLTPTAPQGYPGQNAIPGTVTIRNTHTVTLDVSPANSIGNLVVGEGVSGILALGINANNTFTLTCTGNITVAAGATLQAGGDGGGVHTINLGGNFTTSNIVNFNPAAADVVNVNFNGSANRTISIPTNTSGTYTFNSLTLTTGASSNVNVNDANIRVNGTITFAANGLLVVNSSSNITLGNAATFSGNNNLRYIQLDGTSGANSNLIKINNASTANWVMTFPIGSSTGGYTPLVIPTVTTNPTANSTLSVKAIYKGSSIGALRRIFRLTVTGNAVPTTFSNGVFNFINPTDISTGDVVGNYTTIWSLTAGGVWTNIDNIPAPTTFFTVADGAPATAPLATGTYFYTIGTSTGYPTAWYSYQDGIFSNPEVWTLDPSGTTLDNPLNIAPLPGDQITILNGITVTSDVSNLIIGSTTIEAGATLDMSTTTGNNLGIVSGAGLLRVNGTALPSGTYTAFVATTGGTIEYYNTSGTLPTTQTTYNKLKLTATAGAPIFTLASNLTLNGTFDITTTGGTATWQINNGTANQRTITLSGNLTVGSGGRITVSTSGTAAPHIMTIAGSNFTNSGIVKFFDTTDAQLEEADYTSGAVYTTALKGNAVNVTFTGATDNTVTCSGVTDFYRFIVNKGTGQQALLTVNSSATSNFRLFGPTNIGSGGGVPPNEYSDNSLSIINGTLQLTGSISIANLDMTAGNDYFSIPQNGALWLNGAGVTVNVTDNNPANAGVLTRRLMLSGMIRVTAGTLNGGISAGIGSEDGGAYFQEGGTVTCWQFRPRAAGTGIFSFNMTGGTLNVGYNNGLNGGYDNDDYSRFDLNTANSTFQMSGGVINVAKPTNPSGALGGGIYIGSSPGNYFVTGGTINAYIDLVRTGEDYPFYITSSAPLYNLNVYRASGVATAQILSVAAAAGPPAKIAISSLTVSNNLTLIDGALDPTFSTNNLALTVGGNFDMQSGTTFTPGTSVITFNGTGAQTWTHNGTITSLASVVMSKTAGTTLTLAGANVFPNITTALTLTSGTLADGGKTITVSGTGTLTNNATHSGAGVIDYTSTTGTIVGSGGTFGNLTITTNATIATNGSQTVIGTLRLVGASTTLNIGSNALTVLGNIFSDASPGTAVAFTATKRILTSGFHNAGGLTRQGFAGDLLFPIGSPIVGANPAIPYTPATINVTATTHGTITVRPVNSTHPNVTTTAQSLRYYWRITSIGYVGITSVLHKTYTYGAATEDAASANYRAARYDATAFTWATTSTLFTTPAASAIPDFNTNDGTWSPVIGTQLDGEYTCGNNGAFGAVTVYYSKASGAWNLTTTWSNTGHGGADAAVAPPCATCPVIIGDGSGFNHTVTMDKNNVANDRSCGTLTINTGSTLDCQSFTGMNFGTSTGGAVAGRGTLRISLNVFPAGDFTNFLGASGGTVEWYGNTKTIPTSGPAPQNLSLANYYNLVFNPTTGQTITLPGSNLTIYNNWTQGNPASFAGTVLTNATRTIIVNGDLAVSAGEFRFANNGAITSMTVVRNTTVATGALFGVATTGTASPHSLTTTGSITNNGTMSFNNTSGINIFFIGTNNVSFTGTGSAAAAPLGTTLRFVTVNKGTSETPTVTFDVGGTVNTTAFALGWLTLTNGTFHFDNAAAFTTTISSTTYTIPSTAKLKVSKLATVNIMNADAADANDLFLNGALEVSDGGTVNVGSTTVNTINTDIEYASAGTPTITVSSGTLWVKSSVRRSTSTITGALVYNQTGGTVTVGGIDSNSTPSNTRGVFEIDANTGSSFTMTGSSSLIVQRPTGGTGYADVFINPLSNNVEATSTISVGLNGAAQTLRINIAPSIGNFTVVGGTAMQTVNMYSNPMVLKGTLTIQSPSRLDTNPLVSPVGLNVTIARNLDILGTASYLGGANTTTFNGTVDQTAALTAAPTVFNNMTISKTAGTTLTLSGTAPTLNNLNILTGILNVGALVLNVNGDVTNNSSQIGAGSIVMAGAATTHNIYSTGGSFTNLTLLGSANKVVTVNGNTTINGVLNFGTTNRYLMIKSNQLSFGSAGAVTGNGATAFIRTNGVASDLGVTKTFAVGTSTFNYAVGTFFTPTPVSYSLTTTTAGTLTVIPVNSRHPTYNFGSSESILNYYWIVTNGSDLAATASASHTYSYPSTFFGGTGGTLVAGYLDIDEAPLGWITSGHGGSVNGPPSTVMTFTSIPTTNIPPTGQTYHYTVGTANTLTNPIQPVYSSTEPDVTNLNTGGIWTNTSSWGPNPDGSGGPIASFPRGVPVIIRANTRINTNTSGRRAFSTTINGLLSIGTTVGHSLGILSGTGTMRIATNTFPAGTYTAFVASTGGTIEYVAPMTMNNRSTYNNLSFSGAGTMTMTATDLILNGSMTIPAGVTLNNANNRDIAIAGNWSNLGTFTPGTGTVTFNGTAAQATLGSTAFNNLTMSKPTGNLTLSTTGTTSVTNVLTLTNGHIVSSSAFPLTLTSTATVSGGSATSFVNGLMCKNLNSLTLFSFPLGSIAANRYRPASINNSNALDTWCAQYFGTAPGPTYPHTTLNTSNLGTVSEFEYWDINRTGATVADLTLTYNTGSYLAPDILSLGGTLDKLRVARWDGTQWDLPPGGGTHSQTGDEFSGTITVTNVTNFSPVTNASLDAPSALPIELLSFTGKVVTGGVELLWKTATETNNDFFNIEKSKDGEKFISIGEVDGAGTSKVARSYQFVDENPTNGKSYYRLKQTDFDGKFKHSNVISIDYDGPELVRISVYPNPTKGSEEITLEIKGLKDIDSLPISIFDQLGRQMNSADLQVDGTGSVKRTISVEGMADGMYILKMGTTSNHVRRIVITR